MTAWGNLRPPRGRGEPAPRLPGYRPLRRRGAARCRRDSRGRDRSAHRERVRSVREPRDSRHSRRPRRAGCVLRYLRRAAREPRPARRRRGNRRRTDGARRNAVPRDLPYLYVPESGGVPTTQTLAFILVYAAGIITTFWCLFTAVATFKTRNDPGGTVTLTVTKDGETHTVEVPADNVESAREALSSGVSAASASSAASRTPRSRRGPTPPNRNLRPPRRPSDRRPRSQTRRPARQRPSPTEARRARSSPHRLTSRAPTTGRDRTGTAGTARTSTTRTPATACSPTAASTRRRWTTWRPATGGSETADRSLASDFF